MIRILSIAGTRPEAIKMAPMIRRLAADPRFESRVCVTGQHRQMLDSVLQAFAIRPDHDLNIMRPNQKLADIAAATLPGLPPLLGESRPQGVLVRGDPTPTLAASIAAFYGQVVYKREKDGWNTPFNAESMKGVKLTHDLVNGKTGKSNDTAIAIYLVVSLVIGAAIGLAVGLMLAMT